jgi:hypothetical protein
LLPSFSSVPLFAAPTTRWLFAAIISLQCLRAAGVLT